MQKSDGLINTVVYAIFGKTNTERDPKFAQPWQTHAEHMRSTPDVQKKMTMDTSSGFIAELMNNFVSAVFGKTTGVRDPKYAQPWQTHAEHSVKAPVRESEPATKVYVYSEGILHKFIVLIFGETNGSRDPKFAEPWQSHEDQQRKYTAHTDDKVEKSKVSSKEGGIIDSLIKIVFPGEVGKRDPKYSKPWQTHTEYGKVQSEEAPTEVKKVGAMGGPIDKLVTLLFHVDKNAVRDPKYAKPWQTHEEHTMKVKPASEPQVKKTGGPIPGFGWVDSFVSYIFGSVQTLRDEKWSQPWQTHTEHFRQPPNEEKIKEKKVVSAGGGIIDKIVSSIFGTAKDQTRDAKWSEPWQNHDETVPIVPTSAPETVKAVPSHPSSAPAQPSKKEESTVEKTVEVKEEPNKSPTKNAEDQKFLHDKSTRKFQIFFEAFVSVFSDILAYMLCKEMILKDFINNLFSFMLR